MQSNTDTDILLARIKQLTKYKKANLIEPSHVLFYKDLLWPGCDIEAIRVTLNRLYKEGKITVQNTINDKCISIILKETL